MLKRFEIAAVVLLSLLAVALHVVRAQNAGGLWRDEAGAVQLANLPTIGEVFQRFPHEAFPMLFPLTIRAWTAVFGSSDPALRLFGLTVGIAILGVLWLNARAAGTLPLVSVALLGFHPWFLTYGDSVRGYGLGTVLILLTFWAYARLVERPDGRAIVIAAVTAVLSVHCLLHNAALLLGMGAAAAIVGVVRRRWRVAVAALGVGLLAALSLLPYARPLTAARQWDILVVEELSAHRILLAIAGAFTFVRLPVYYAWLTLLAVSLLAALWMLIRKADPEPAATDARLFRLLAVPAAFAAQYGLFVALGYHPRIWYCLPLMALMASAVDGLLASPERFPVLRLARLAAAATFTALLLPAAYQEAKLRMTNIDRIAQHLGAHARRRDLIVVNPWFYGISFHRYYQGRARWMTIPRLADHRMHRYDLIKARMTSEKPIGDVLRMIHGTLRSGNRVWVVGAYDVPPAGQPPIVLEPAPGSPWGWADAPYTASWSYQLGAFLQRQEVRQWHIHVPAGGGVNSFEDLDVYAFQGGREQGRRSRRPGRPSTAGR